MLGRIEEEKELLDAESSPRSEFIAVYGRRRIGKTFLVQSVFDGRFSFVHTGLAKSTAKIQLRKFRSSLRDAGLGDCSVLKDWFDAFEELQRLLKGLDAQRKIVFIDEMPWLDTPRSNFVSALENFWNGWAARRSDILLIVCGSATSWIIENVLRDKGGLHNRVTRQISLKPFSLGECERFVQSQGLALSRSEIAEAYMVFGGVPWYWSLLRPGRSVAQEIDRLFFSEGAVLAGEFRALFDSLFRTGSQHVKVVEALASRRSGMTRAELAAAAALPENGALTRMLEELEQCGFIRAYRPFGARRKGTTYQLVDCFSLFHHRFLSVDSASAGIEGFWMGTLESGPRRVWTGLAFELVCLLHLRQIRRSLGIGGVLCGAYSWRSAAEGVPGAQIDLVIDRADKVVDLCEMKWSESPYRIDKAEHEAIVRRKEAFIAETRTNKAVHCVLVASSGMERNKYSGAIQAVVTLDDLFSVP